MLLCAIKGDTEASSLFRNRTFNASVNSLRSSALITAVYLLTFTSVLTILSLMSQKLSVSRTLKYFFVFQIWVITSDVYQYGYSQHQFDRYAISSMQFFVFGIGYYSLVSSAEGLKLALRSMLLVGLLFVIANSAAIIFTPQGAIWKNRFFGLTDHPNFLGVGAMAIGLFSLIICFDVTETIFSRLLGTLSGLCSLYLIVGSGSRGAAVALVIGLLVQLWPSVLKCCVVIASGGLAVYNSNLFDTTELDDLRILSVNNTRGEVTNSFIEVIANNPIFGSGTEGIPTSNSYLYALSSVGVVGFTVLLCSLRSAITGCAHKSGLETPHVRYMKRGILSVVIALLTAAVFEGFLLDSFGFQLQCVFVAFSLSDVLSKSKWLNAPP